MESHQQISNPSSSNDTITITIFEEKDRIKNFDELLSFIKQNRLSEEVVEKLKEANALFSKQLYQHLYHTMDEATLIFYLDSLKMEATFDELNMQNNASVSFNFSKELLKIELLSVIERHQHLNQTITLKQLITLLEKATNHEELDQIKTLFYKKLEQLKQQHQSTLTKLQTYFSKTTPLKPRSFIATLFRQRYEQRFMNYYFKHKTMKWSDEVLIVAMRFYLNYNVSEEMIFNAMNELNQEELK